MSVFRSHRLANFQRILALMAVCGMIMASLVSPSWADAPRVVVTIKPIHSLATQLLAGITTPTLLVEGAASPHTFTLRPSQAGALHRAHVFVRVSETVEPFTRKITGALDPSVRVVTLITAEGVKLLPMRHGGQFEAHDHTHDKHSHDDHASDAKHDAHHHKEHSHDDHGHDKHDHAEKKSHDDDHGHDHDHHAGEAHDHHAEHSDDAKDGHIWLDPDNAIAIVEALNQEFKKAFPDHARALDQNAKATIAQLKSLAGELESEMAEVKGKNFIVFHDATQYFERRFGVEAVGAITLSPDVKPGARRLSDVRYKIEELGAVCVFAEPGFQPKLLDAVTEGTKAKSGSVDPEGLNVKASASAYAEILRGLARSLKSCLAQ